MVTRELAVSERERPLATVEAADRSFHMDEESFRAFYDRTARPLWAYLSRVSGNHAVADDLFQACYLRFLTARLPQTSEAHRKNYLFRIATNLLRDHFRRRKGEYVAFEEMPALEQTAEKLQRQSELTSALKHLKLRERELLWLAYVEGFSHRQIAELVGLKAESIRPLLFRARQKLAAILRGRGVWAPDRTKGK